MRLDAEPKSTRVIVTHQAPEGTYERLAAIPEGGQKSNKLGCRVNIEWDHNQKIARLTIDSRRPISIEEHFLMANPDNTIAILGSRRIVSGQGSKPIEPTLDYLLRRIDQAFGVSSPRNHWR